MVLISTMIHATSHANSATISVAATTCACVNEMKSGPTKSRVNVCYILHINEHELETWASI